MSAKWMGYFFDETELAGSELLLALAIADHADVDGIAWPGVTSLAKKIRLGERRTKGLISSLRERGYLEIRSEPGRGHLAVLQLKKVQSVAPLNTDKGCNPGAGKGAIPEQEKVQSERCIYKKNHPEPSVEPTVQDLPWQIALLIEVFPHMESKIVPGNFKMILDAVEEGDADAWQATLDQYRGNYNPATNSWLPERVGTVLEVFRKHKQRRNHHAEDLPKPEDKRAVEAAARTQGIKRPPPSAADVPGVQEQGQDQSFACTAN